MDTEILNLSNHTHGSARWTRLKLILICREPQTEQDISFAWIKQMVHIHCLKKIAGKA